MGCVSDLPMLSFALRPGPGLEDTIGKCTAGHPAGFWRKSLKRLAENHMCHGQTKVCFLNKRDWSSHVISPQLGGNIYFFLREPISIERDIYIDIYRPYHYVIHKSITIYPMISTTIGGSLTMPCPVGVGGSGRKSLATLAAVVAEQACNGHELGITRWSLR